MIQGALLAVLIVTVTIAVASLVGCLIDHFLDTPYDRGVKDFIRELDNYRKLSNRGE